MASLSPESPDLQLIASTLGRARFGMLVVGLVLLLGAPMGSLGFLLGRPLAEAVGGALVAVVGVLGGAFMLRASVRSTTVTRALMAELEHGRGLLWAYKEDGETVGGAQRPETLYLFDAQGRMLMGTCYSGQGASVMAAIARACPTARIGFDKELQWQYKKDPKGFVESFSPPERT